jgi:tetratricopeptide (TPR) repeat protein
MLRDTRAMAVSPWGCVAALFALSLAWISTASADVLLEVRVEPVRAQDATVIEAFRHELEILNAAGKSSVQSRPAEVLKVLGRRAPRHGHFDPALTSQQLFDQLADAYQSYTKGEYQLAVKQLESALGLVHQNPTLVVAHSESRELVTRALIGLALARARLGDSSGSLAAMSEQLRSFPELPATEDEYGPEGYRLYDNARKRIEGKRRGSLLVEVRNPDARIFINEFGRGRGGIFSGDLMPGSYRVLIEIGALGRVYDVQVRSNEQTRLQVDWAMDSAFVATKSWVGISLLASAGKTISQYAGALARRLHVADLTVFSISWDGRRRYLSAATFSMETGNRMRAGSVELDSGPVGNDLKIQGLAEQVFLGRRSGLVLPLVWDAPLPDKVATATATAVMPPRAAASDQSASTLTLALGGTAAVALLAGAGLFYLDETGECGLNDRDCVPFGLARTWEAGLFGLSIACATSATIAYLIDHDPAMRAATVSLRPRSGGVDATVGWTF